MRYLKKEYKAKLIITVVVEGQEPENLEPITDLMAVEFEISANSMLLSSQVGEGVKGIGRLHITA